MLFSKIPSTFMHRKVKYIYRSSIHRSLSAPKKINEKLKKDILANGMLKPLQIQSQIYRNCLIGNQRLLILQSLGIEKVPVIFISERTERKEKPKNSINKINKISRISGRSISGKERVKNKRIN